MLTPPTSQPYGEYAKSELKADSVDVALAFLRQNPKKDAELRTKWQEQEEAYGIWQKQQPIDTRFKEENLLEHIWRELDKTHKLDHKQKLVLFLVAVSAELPNAKQRVSAALKGDSSSGKDNLVDSVFAHFPKRDTIKWTSATPAAFRDAVLRGKRFALSEVNKDREGANYQLTEKLKQLAEGGIKDTLKEQIGKKWVNVDIESPQKTVVYSTTESAIDDELHTRFIVLPVYSSVEKNKVVVKDTLLKFSSPHEQIASKKRSWIAESIASLDSDLYVYIPFLTLFTEPIQDENGKETFLFDLRKERVKRDVKRLIALTCAVTWLHQHQRHKEFVEGQMFALAEPSDFLTALTLCAEFFDLSYSGLDHRVQKTLDLIKKHEGKQASEISKWGYSIEYADWVLRNTVQEELGVTLNTIKEHIKTLEQYGLVQTFYSEDTRRVILSTKNSPINSPINDLSIPVSVKVIDRLLTGWLTGKKQVEIYKDKEIKPIRLSFLPTPYISGQIDRSTIDTSISLDSEVVQEPCTHGFYVGEDCLFCRRTQEVVQ